MHFDKRLHDRTADIAGVFSRCLATAVAVCRRRCRRRCCCRGRPDLRSAVVLPLLLPFAVAVAVAVVVAGLTYAQPLPCHCRCRLPSPLPSPLLLSLPSCLRTSRVPQEHRVSPALRSTHNSEREYEFLKEIQAASPTLNTQL
jgi:hypothetical protein